MTGENIPEPEQELRKLWHHYSDLRPIANRVAASGGMLRIVGGAVRDVLCNRPIGDIDLASTLPPQKLMVLLAEIGIKTVPTGIDHGTITMVLDGRGYEITTLRRDIDSDGRHAEVVFTDDWQADAGRRDFTFNAMYVDADGKLYDYFSGQADLKAGRVRFIGDAALRIKEDVLRILRFYRFYAWFGRGEPDAEALAACDEMADRLPQLSAERVWREIAKLLMAHDPVPAIRLMLAHRALGIVVPEIADGERLRLLVSAETEHHVEPSAVRRLAAMLPGDPDIMARIAKRLKLPNRDGERLAAIAACASSLSTLSDRSLLQLFIYRHGVDLARDVVLLKADANPSAIAAALCLIDQWPHPKFPLRGEDILALGVAAGPKVGTMLKAVEDWWIARDFKPARDECLAEARLRSDSLSYSHSQ